MSNIWEQFQKPASGEYPDRWRPETVGDSIGGKITEIRVATMPDGSQYPSLTVLTKDGEKEILASQAMLLRQLATAQPKIGDVITIVFTSIEKLSAGRTLKHFDFAIGSSTPVEVDLI
jgi:hypothetical protein